MNEIDVMVGSCGRVWSALELLFYTISCGSFDKFGSNSTLSLWDAWSIRIVWYNKYLLLTFLKLKLLLFNS